MHDYQQRAADVRFVVSLILELCVTVLAPPVFRRCKLCQAPLLAMLQVLVRLRRLFEAFLFKLFCCCRKQQRKLLMNGNLPAQITGTQEATQLVGASNPAGAVLLQAQRQQPLVL